MSTLGILGLLLYTFILGNIVYDISTSNLDRELKYSYLALIIAVIFMNFASNSYLSRFELNQFFFFIIGIFYALRDLHVSKKSD